MYIVDLGPADTPLGLNPVVSASQINGVPARGTGLNGEVYVSQSGLGSIGQLASLISGSSPDFTFNASEVLYGRGSSNITLSEFLRQDAASLSSDGSTHIYDNTGLTLSGFIYIPPGKHQVTVVSDDGFALSLGGIGYSSFEFGRGAAPTSRTAIFEGGLYQIDLAYFDGFGGQELRLEIDGLPVDQSALYSSVDDFLNNAADAPLVPKADYHPSYFLGEDTLDGADSILGSAKADEIYGGGGDDSLAGRFGNDHIEGGYGDDILRGDKGNDVIDGGRGSDLLLGGDGDDVLISRSDVGEQRIGQLAIGDPTRGDPDNEVNNQRQKLKGYEDQELVGDDILVGGAGRDIFLFSPLLNAKAEIIHKHTRSDGTINWAGVAGENNELHDHWVDAFGIDMIADFRAHEDTIAVIGHTASDIRVRYVDTDRDGDDESIVTVYSNQHGGGGAHDDDLLGVIIVHGDRVEADDIITDAGVTYGIVDNISDLAEAIAPDGELKESRANGTTYFGYDSRTAGGSFGPLLNRPWAFDENPHEESNLFSYARPSSTIYNNSRGTAEQLGILEIDGVTIEGTDGNDVLSPPTALPEVGLPGALGFWRFDEDSGTVADERGGNDATIYRLDENTPVQQFDPVLTDGPTGTPNSALVLNGEDDFVFIEHDPEYQISQGTIAVWIRPDDLSDDAIIISKDERGAGEGGHFLLGHDDTGRIFLRFAEGDGGGNRSWETSAPYLQEGQWTHLAVSFTEEGLTVYVDGVAVPDFAWQRIEGNVDNPGIYKLAFLTENSEPWVLGADTSGSEINDTAGELSVDDRNLDDAFTGAIADFGIWGGELTTAERDEIEAQKADSAVSGPCGQTGGPVCHCGGADGELGYALNWKEVMELFTNGPGTALTAASGNQPIASGDDLIEGGAGFDTIMGGGGDDTLRGGDDADSIEGGYGDDILEGGDGNDALEGGRGSDLLLGGAGNDLLVSRSDAGEQRIGQLALGEPSRPDPDNEVNYARQKLYGWEDQALVADDVLVGGEGYDTFLFNAQINAKRDIIMKHVRDDRTINWAGVAGENNELHDHWVDSFGIDIIADYNADEDNIAIIGHTADPTVSYQGIDNDGDGVDDEVISIITVYSQQGNNGGAHDEDLIGQIIVHGDLVNEDDLVVNAGVTHGIVDTIDDLQEALAPTGELKKTVLPNGEIVFGYDSRSPETLIKGNKGAVTGDPNARSENPFLDSGLFTFDNPISADLPAPVSLFGAAGRRFDGNDDFLAFAHKPVLAQETGTIALTVSPNKLSGTQTILSKDSSGNLFGGHLNISVDSSGRLKVKFETAGQTFFLQSSSGALVKNQVAQVVFTFNEEETVLYVDGFPAASGPGWPGGMTGNAEPLVIGASASDSSSGGTNNLDEHFSGYIRNVLILDRDLEAGEAFLLSEDQSELRGRNEALDDVSDRGMPMVMGGVGDDVLRSDHIGEEVVGYFGADRLYGEGGIDTLYGGEGDDTLFGGTHGDTLFGGSGDDTLDGQGGADQLYGGEGSDILIGGAAADRLDGGDGYDTASYDTANSPVLADLQGLVAAKGDALGDIYVSIENLIGGDKHDQLRGDEGRNVIHGGDSNDRLYGRAGDDNLNGDDGNDVLYGNAGADRLTGGRGNDRFVYFNLSDSRAPATDLISDFDLQGNDRIELWRIDADTTRGGNQAFTFVGDAGFSGTAGELTFVQNVAAQSTRLRADVDGDGRTDFEIRLSGLVNFDETDFVL
ncbi:MAG: LamG-like jellyroll fold domain-containing protein [Pseudomonadota bacterium]